MANIPYPKARLTARGPRYLSNAPIPTVSVLPVGDVLLLVDELVDDSAEGEEGGVDTARLSCPTCTNKSSTYILVVED